MVATTEAQILPPLPPAHELPIRINPQITNLFDGHWIGSDPMVKIKVVNALQTRFGPSKYTSQNNPTKPNLKLKISLEVLDIICPPQEPTSVGHCHYKTWS